MVRLPRRNSLASPRTLDTDNRGPNSFSNRLEVRVSLPYFHEIPEIVITNQTQLYQQIGWSKPAYRLGDVPFFLQMYQPHRLLCLADPAVVNNCAQHSAICRRHLVSFGFTHFGPCARAHELI